jgi:hydrogenase small subunit
MALTRRELLGTGIGTFSVLSLSVVKIPGLGNLARAADPAKVAEVPVIWMATGSCSGCSVALINTSSPSIQELLLGEVLPGKHVSLGFHATVMAAAGESAMQAMEKVTHEHKGGYVLVVDGAVASKDNGVYCGIGERNGHPITAYEHVRDLGRDAMAVLAVGACSSFGGIPAAGPNPTGCLSAGEVFELEGIQTPYVNIPGCPPHPDWIVGTIATVLVGGLEALGLDERHRPAPFFRKSIHDNCPYRADFENGNFAEHFGEHGCLLKLGCKGPITYADCPIRKFNNGTSWCCQAGHPCIGCCNPEFPFQNSMFTPIEPAQLPVPAAYPPAHVETAKKVDTGTYVTLGLIGGGAFLAGAGVALAARKLNDETADHSGEPPSAPEPKE